MHVMEKSMNFGGGGGEVLKAYLSQSHTGLYYNDKFIHISQIKIAYMYMYIYFCCLTNKYYIFQAAYFIFKRESLVHLIRH